MCDKYKIQQMSFSQSTDIASVISFLLNTINKIQNEIESTLLGKPKVNSCAPANTNPSTSPH